MTPIPDKALEVIAGRKQVSTVYAKVDMILGDVFVTDADLARELIEARKEIERLKSGINQFIALEHLTGNDYREFLRELTTRGAENE